MSDAYVQVAPDSTGKKIQTFENTVSGNLVESQAVVLVNSSGAPITPVTGAGGSNTQVQYNNSTAFGGITGATTDGAKMTLTTPDITTGFTIGGSAAAAGSQIFGDATTFNNPSAALISPTFRYKITGVSVLTAGAPADIATVALVTWAHSIMCTPVMPDVLTCRLTAAGGTNAAAQFVLRDTSGGGGNALSAVVVGPTAAGLATFGSGLGFGNFATTFFIRQTVNSANTGTADFYILCYKV